MSGEWQGRATERLPARGLPVLAMVLASALLIAACGTSNNGSTSAGPTSTTTSGASAGSTAAPTAGPTTTAAPASTTTTAAPTSTTTTSTAPPKPAAPKPGKVLVVGDSVAFSVAASVLQASPNGSALGIQQLHSKAVIACTLARWSTKARAPDGKVSDVPVCSTWPDMWAPELLAHPDTSLLIIGNAGAQELLTPDGQWVRPCDAGYADRMKTDLTDAMKMLKENSGRVAVTTAGYWRPPPARQLPGVDYKSFDVHTDCLNTLIKTVAQDVGVPVIDLGAWICPTADTCRVTEGNVTLRPDGLHYDGPGGPIAMKYLLSQLPD